MCLSNKSFDRHESERELPRGSGEIEFDVNDEDAMFPFVYSLQVKYTIGDEFEYEVIDLTVYLDAQFLRYLRSKSDLGKMSAFVEQHHRDELIQACVADVEAKANA